MDSPQQLSTFGRIKRKLKKQFPFKYFTSVSYPVTNMLCLKTC